VRSALGASRGRLLRHLLAESALLAAGGTALGLALTAVAVRVLAAAGPEVLPRAAELRLGGPVVWFTAAVAAASLVLFGLIPAARVVGTEFERALPAAGRSLAGGLRTQRVRRLLVASQIAVAVPLLVGAGLLMRSFVRLQQVDPGFPTERLLTVGLPISAAAYPDGDTRVAFWQRATERAAALPGAVSAAGTAGRPPGEFPFENDFNLEDRPTPPDRSKPTCPWTVVTRGYFRTLGIPLVRGRLFDSRDRPDDPVAVVVDETWARRFYPDEDPIGRRLTEGGCDSPVCNRLTVIGVVGDVKYTGLDDPGRGVVYLVDRQNPLGPGFLVVRTAAEPLALLADLRAAMHEIDPALPLSRVATMGELVRGELAAPRSFLGLIAGFAAVALLLAVVGIYGVMSFFVQQHAREIGIRMAIGCEPGSVLALVVGRGVSLAALGLGVGIVGALALTRYLSSRLFEVSATDPTTFAAVAAGIGLTALVA
jgi:putative ABC transport system permease protein